MRVRDPYTGAGVDYTPTPEQVESTRRVLANLDASDRDLFTAMLGIPTGGTK